MARLLLVVALTLALACSASANSNNPDCQAPIKLVLDTDMGLDDITLVGLIFAHTPTNTHIRSNTQKIEVLGMSTVDGIAHVGNGTKNLLRILQRIGRADVKVYSGEVLVNGTQGHIIRPFNQVWRPFMDLLPGVNLPPLLIDAEKESAAQFLVRISREHPGFTLLATGPLSNVAMAMELDHTFPSRVGKLVVMGGAVYVPGNAPGGFAEWNLYVDPWATAKVFNSGAFSGKTEIAPIDVTNYWWYVNASAAVRNVTAADAVGAYIQNVIAVAVANNYQYLFDPCSLELILRPDLEVTQITPLAAVPSGDASAKLYVVQNPNSGGSFTWARVALQLDVTGTQAWYACSVQGNCTK